MPGTDAPGAACASFVSTSRNTESQRRIVYIDCRGGRLDAARLAAHLCEWNSPRGSLPAHAGTSWRSRAIFGGDGPGAANVYAPCCASRTEMGFFPGWVDQGRRQAYRGLEAARAGGKSSGAV